MRLEKSGLASTTLELARASVALGHDVDIRQPGDDVPFYGRMSDCDVHTIHSQLGQSAYADGKPKFFWCHGEPISSVGNGVSMKAIVDLAPQCEAFIAMRKEELPVWSAIKRTYLVNKGIDLETFKPLPTGTVERLSGEPSVLYYENWRGQRNPLIPILAMQIVWKKYPNAKLHLYNCPTQSDGKSPMKETFAALIKNCKWWTFIPSIWGPVDDVNRLLNQVDIVVSGLYPLYARSIEAFGAGKAFIGAGYKEPGYPWQCEFTPESMADAIIRCWESYDSVNYRQWATDRHNVLETAKQAADVYARYV